MAQINEFFKKKYGKEYGKEKTEKSEPEDYKKKLARHRKKIFLRVLIIVAVTAAVVVLLYLNFNNRVFTDYDTINQLSISESNNADYLNLNGNVLRFSKDGASAFNASDDMLWNQTYEMQNPMIDICGDYAAIGDYKGTRIYVFNGNGLQGEIDTTLPVQTFCVSGIGSVATVLEENEITWVRLFNKTGQLIANDRTTMAKSGYPVRIAISPDGVMLGVSYLRIDTGAMSSSVAFYNFGAVGQNEIDNLVSGYDYPESVISEVAFMNEKAAFAVGDNGMEVFSGAQKPEQIAQIPIEDEITSVFYGKDHIGLVFTDTTSEMQYRLEVYDSSGERVRTCNFNLDYKDILLQKDQIIVYNSDECIIFNMQGTEKFHSTFHHSIITMIPTANQNRYILVSGTSMEEIQLK
ncbi:MAG: hypothetical protein J5518_08350 [Lachnospiraceae bacterium]|nr:hypothetical protein [Lachnospiraceae bacterium]